MQDEQLQSGQPLTPAREQDTQLNATSESGEGIQHTVTQEDLVNNPGLEEVAKVGDEVTLGPVADPNAPLKQTQDGAVTNEADKAEDLNPVKTESVPHSAEGEFIEPTKDAPYAPFEDNSVSRQA